MPQAAEDQPQKVEDQPQKGEDQPQKAEDQPQKVEDWTPQAVEGQPQQAVEPVYREQGSGEPLGVQEPPVRPEERTLLRRVILQKS
jgi:hypothetical protein